MGLTIRIYDIYSPNDFRIYLKKGDTAYPLNSGYYLCNGIYSGGTELVTITGYNVGNVATELEFNTQYWIKLVDTKTNRYIIENIYINDEIAFPCDCTPPLITSVQCYLDDYDCRLELTATFVGYN